VEDRPSNMAAGLSPNSPRCIKSSPILKQRSRENSTKWSHLRLWRQRAGRT